jgi:hypothetical protein
MQGVGVASVSQSAKKKRQNTAALHNVAVLANVYWALAFWSAALRRFSRAVTVPSLLEQPSTRTV